jgi:hypothetical protein
MKFTVKLKWIQAVAGHNHIDITATIYGVNRESFATIETIINRELGRRIPRSHGCSGYECKTVEVGIYDAYDFIGNANRKPLVTYLLKRDEDIKRLYNGYIMRGYESEGTTIYGVYDRATFIADTLRILRIRCGVDTVDESSFYASLSK